MTIERGPLARILGDGVLSSVYQPIVDLDTRTVFGFEALARGPHGSALARPDQLFAAAADLGLTSELDWECQASAFQGALAAGLGTGAQLFVNIEPCSLGTPRPTHLDHLFAQACSALSVIVEITERALLDDPAAVIRTLDMLRAVGFGIALDDVGANPDSLALLPFLEPDVIKLDLHLVQQRADAEIAAIATAVGADAERRNAIVLAEGIETLEHLDRARVLGAQLGQGWLFGRPRPLCDPSPSHSTPFKPKGVASTAATPWELVRDRPDRRTTTKALLMPMSDHLEQHGTAGPDRAVVLSAFQQATHFTPATAARYERLARRCSLVGAIARDLRPFVAGVRHGTLTAGHPLEREWTVTVVTPHYAGALIAREHHETSDNDSERVFDYVITYDRPTVIAAARSLMQHLAPIGST